MYVSTMDFANPWLTLSPLLWFKTQIIAPIFRHYRKITMMFSLKMLRLR